MSHGFSPTRIFSLPSFLGLWGENAKEKMTTTRPAVSVAANVRGPVAFSPSAPVLSLSEILDFS
jgi:hypothetical protein